MPPSGSYCCACLGRAGGLLLVPAMIFYKLLSMVTSSPIATTYIAKLTAASTLHVRTSFGPLNHIIAVRAFSPSIPSCKGYCLLCANVLWADPGVRGIPTHSASYRSARATSRYIRSPILRRRHKQPAGPV